MRILLASSSSGSQGGGELFLLSLGRALAELGHHVTLWASNHERMTELCDRFRSHGEVFRSNYRNTYDRRFRNFSGAIDLATARRVAADWRSLNPDVIHLNKQNLEDAPELIWAANLSHIPSVCSVHITQSASYLKAQFSSIRDGLARGVLQRFPGKIVAISENRLTDLDHFLRGRAETVLVRNGVRIPPLAELGSLRAAKRAELELKPHQLVCIGVGRMVEQKRPLLFLSLAEKVVSKIPNAIFYWVGDGPVRPRWDDFVAERKLNSHVFVTGWVSDVHPYFAAADLFFHTAAFEGLPLAVLEGMAAGLPLVLTQNLLDDLDFLDPTVAIVAEEKQVDWIEAINSPAERQRLGSAGRDLSSKQFSLERMAKDYLRLYRAALQSACGSDFTSPLSNSELAD
jgi:glycosyltransferase involved in cell wall biosynthesis